MTLQLNNWQTEPSAEIRKLGCKQSLMKVVSSNLAPANFFLSFLSLIETFQIEHFRKLRLLQGWLNKATDFECNFMT